MGQTVVSNDGDSVGGFVSLDVGITRLSDVNRPKSCPSNIQQLPGGYQLIPPDPEDEEYYNASYIGRIVFNPWAAMPDENTPNYVAQGGVLESSEHRPYHGAGSQQEQASQETSRSKQKRRAEDDEMDDVEEDDGQKKVRLDKFPCDKCYIVLEGEESWRNHLATPIHQEKDGEVSPRTVSTGMNTSA